MSTLVLVAQCTFLHNLLMLNISFGCCRHSVSNTVVQLTEGRSARDKPKQLPAKIFLGSLGVVLSCDGIEGVPTRCFFVLFVLTRRQPLRVESV